MRHFQKLLGFVMLNVTLASFKLSNGFIIKGHIEGVKDCTWVTLYDLDQQAFLDSALTKGGKFLLRGKVEHPTTCWLKCNGEYAIIQVENTEIHFTSPLKDMFLHSSVRGGREQELQNELKRLQLPHDLVNKGVYDSLMNKKYRDDDDKKRLIDTFNSSQSASTQIYINFGKNHPCSYRGLDILYRNRTRVARDSLALIYQKLRPAFKETA
jgi:hypothetical protein